MKRDTVSSAAELGQNLVRRNHLSASSFFVAAGDCSMQTRAVPLVKIVAVVNDGQIDLRPLGSIVGLVQFQSTFVNL